MHSFHYKNKALYAEDIALSSIADQVGTPAYVYSHATFMDHFQKLTAAFKPIDPVICYSMKANSNLTLCKALVDAGSGIDIVSGGELYRALAIATSPEKIVYASVGKTVKEITAALEAGILCFNVESRPELVVINQVAEAMGVRARVALRVNPDVDADTHDFITTGTHKNKFGIDTVCCCDIFKERDQFPACDFIGLHVHIGSQITTSSPFVHALKAIEMLVERIRVLGVRLEYLNIGGGLGIKYKDETPQTPATFAEAVLPLLQAIGLKVILEPGRFIMGNAGVLLTKALYVKKTPAKTFVIIDAAMNDLMRPSLYGSYHDILPLRRSVPVSAEDGPVIVCDIVGPICESGDFFAKDRELQQVQAGDILAVMSAGAYGFTMSSNYNSRPRVCEVLVKGDSHYLIRRRETYEDMLATEVIPDTV